MHGLKRTHVFQERSEGKLDLSGGKPDDTTVEEGGREGRVGGRGGRGGERKGGR